MSNVIQLHHARHGRGNDPRAIFLAVEIESGLPAAMRKLRTRLWMMRPEERDGRFAVVGGQLLHLTGWCTCPVTADIMHRSLDSQLAKGVARSMRLLRWPYDVSGWPSIVLNDAPALWHMPADAHKEMSNGAA